MYRYSTITNDSGNKNNYITPITTGMWTPKIEYVVNMRSHTFDVYYNDSLVASSLPFLNSSFTTADYIIFGTRATGFSKYWFKDVEIVPVEEEIISEINVSSSCLPYTSYTKDYLYSASDLSDKTVTVNNTSVNYGSDVISNETNYTNIDLVSSSAHGSIALNHRVYYELNVSREGITKSLEEALDLKEKKYTASSWNDLVNAKNAAINVLSNSEETSINVQTAKTNLDNAIASLVLKSSSGIRYTGSISMGNRYENEPNTEISITNDSSITINAKLNVIVGSTYSYIDTPHNRKLVSNSVLPENTKITFIDKSNGEYKYYYYIVTAQDVIDSKQEYELSSFISMENHNNYINGTYFDTNRVYEDFDFIIDFKECNIKLSNGVYSVKLQSLVGTETRDMTSLSYTVSDQMGSSILSLSIGEESIKKNDILNLSIYGNRINGIYNNKEVINTNREGTKMGVKFTLWNESKTEQLQMPKNTTISFNGYTCKVSSNACILYIGDIAKSEVSDAVLKFGFDSNLEAGKYIIKGEFFRSPNGLIPETIMSSNELELIITSENQDGFKVSLDNISKNVIKEGYPHTIMYEINKSNEAEANIVLSIYKKQNNEYVIDNLSNYINDSLEPFDINKYSIGNVSAWETTLSSNIKKGTYRLAFELYRNSKLESVVYKYIVIK